MHQFHPDPAANWAIETGNLVMTELPVFVLTGPGRQAAGLAVVEGSD